MNKTFIISVSFVILIIAGSIWWDHSHLTEEECIKSRIEYMKGTGASLTNDIALSYTKDSVQYFAAEFGGFYHEIRYLPQASGNHRCLVVSKLDNLMVVKEPLLSWDEINISRLSR